MAEKAGAYMAEHGIKFFKKVVPTKVLVQHVHDTEVDIPCEGGTS